MKQLRIGTFNVRGIASNTARNLLDEDISTYKLDVVCLQETKIKDGCDSVHKASRILCFETSKHQYGLGFAISKRVNISEYWQVSDRICVLQIKLSENSKRICSIINVYAPQTDITSKDPAITEHFYDQLTNVAKNLKGTLLYIAGDFNASPGIKEVNDTTIGNYCYNNKTNSNSEYFSEFRKDQKLFATNTAFMHKKNRRYTWLQKRVINDKVKTYRSQIDFILCSESSKHFLQNSRSYTNTLTSSDHNLVICLLNIEWHTAWRKPTPREPKYAVSKLSRSTEVKTRYQQTLDENLAKNPTEGITLQTKWNSISEAIKSAAEISVGLQERPKHNNRSPDAIIGALSVQQKQIRQQINNSDNANAIRALRKKRNKIQRDISKRVQLLRNEELDNLMTEIDNTNDAAKMFKATKMIHQKPPEKLKVHNDSGKFATDPNEILKITGKFFQDKFVDEDADEIDAFTGPPRPLNNPLTVEEVRKGLNRLNNNRATGPDAIPGELYKYGSAQMTEAITNMYNEIFEKHADIDINTGNMITPPKPGKPKGPTKNLRPLTLLNTIRKALSLITLERIRTKVTQYISSNQSGFQPDRSTADVVWTHKWLSAKCSITKDLKFFITGIDMSAAFDTINRKELLNILADNVTLEEDELRLIRFLLSNTVIRMRVSAATETYSFTANTGTPQGDGLSPVLFIIYLENALKNVRLEPEHELLPNEVAYADDVDFVSMKEHRNVTEIQDRLKPHQLNVNTDKTEYTTIQRSADKTVEKKWRTTKKVGSLIGDVEDVARRKSLSTAALNKLNNVWIKKDKIKQTTRIKLYNALSKSILTYNCSTWALTASEEESLDAHHRRQLRRVIGIKYPTTIKNEKLYEICNAQPLSITILKARWTLFGHILRRDQNIPANKSMKFYFTNLGTNFKGKPRTTLPTKLADDLDTLHNYLQAPHTTDHNYTTRPTPKLRKKEDLERLTTIAQDRTEWRSLIRRILEARRAGAAVVVPAEA